MNYKVHKSFWAQEGCINWDTAEHGREGVGIPVKIVKAAHNRGEKIRVVIEESGTIYRVSPSVVLEHDRKWQTTKTAPKGAKNLSIVLPVALMEFIRFTPEKQKMLEAHRLEVAEKKRISELQPHLF